MNTAFGIDIGGSGVKGARVDLDRGELEQDRIRVSTPQPATPDAVMEVIAQITALGDWSGPVGCTFPAVVQHGVIHNATNIDDSWIGVNAEQRLQEQRHQPARVLNDADAAGIAEMKYGAGVEYCDRGVVIMLTFGTGIGSAIFNDGILLPNTELGELELNGHIAETRTAGRFREEKILSWKKWTKRVQGYLEHVEKLFWPDLIIFGGGISEQADRFLPKLETRAQLVPAKLRNNAGIVGAALAVSSM